MTMKTLKVHDFLRDKILVSRESARSLEAQINALMKPDQDPTGVAQRLNPIIDFEGIEGVTPSFLDELLIILKSLEGAPSASEGQDLIIANPPMRISSKFEAVARGHGMNLELQRDGSWKIRTTQASAD